MTISIIICTYNRAESLKRMLATLIPANVQDVLEVLVVDNNSRDHTREVLAEYAGRHPELFRPMLETKPGQGAALNRAIRAARGDVLVFTDDDVLLPGNWMDEIRKALAAHPDCGVFGGRVKPVPPEGMAFPAWVHWEDPHNTAEGPLVDHNKGRETKSYHEPGMCTPVGANFFLRRQAVERNGLFPEADSNSDEPLRAVDSVWFNQARNRGEAVMYVPTVVVNHVTDPRRMTKEYFSWYFLNSAKTCVASTPGGQEEASRLFNVPRWFYVKLARSLWVYLESMLSREPESLVYAKKLQLLYFWGVVTGFMRGWSWRGAARRRAHG